MMAEYQDFLARKNQANKAFGFEPLWLPDFLFPFQRALVEWAIRQGRAALFEDCGLGKSPQQLVWAENVARKTDKPVLIATPLAVSYQTVREAEKFGIDIFHSRDGKYPTSRIIITNYERLHYFDPNNFSGMICDESSILKSFAGRTRTAITDFMRTLPYRLLCTATAAPNDYFELGTSSEALGYLGYTDMLTMFFREECQKDHLGWGRKTYRFRGHGAEPFWQWVCSWARALRRPSDLGFSDDGFMLPELTTNECVLKQSKPRNGYLVPIPAQDLREQREERRITIRERCEAAAERAMTENVSVVWCHLNSEGDLLEELISDCVQVKGSQSDEIKEERLLAFQAGQIKRLVTKPKIGCFGLNWQHCHNIVTFPSHSWEQYYQAVRRCWRFGQKCPVAVAIVTTEGEQRVIGNLKRKAAQADKMFSALVKYVNKAVAIDNGWCFDKKELIPYWLGKDMAYAHGPEDNQPMGNL